MIIFKKLSEFYGERLKLNFFSKFLKLNKTTSIHILNADRGLSTPFKILYFLLNKLNNLLPYYKIDKNLEIHNFVVNDLKENWSKLYITNSPSRKISDLFWINLPWNSIKRELKEINILDIGCGSGNCGDNFVNFSNNNINSYVGLDVKSNENWIKLQKKYSFFQFYKFEGKDFTDMIPPKTNFFVTQAALEHFEEDISFFNYLKDFICSSRKNVIQIHIFPSSASLPLERFHGVRQYTPRTFSKITRLFMNFSYVTLFNFGGKCCNYLHYKYITEPKRKRLGDMRIKKTQEYDKLSYMAIKKDMKNQQKSPSSYALIIHSNWERKISF